MAVLTLKIENVKYELPDFYDGYNPNKIYLTSDICYAISHLITKIEGIEYECKKIYGSEGLYVILMEKSNYECVPQVFLSKFCFEQYFSENSKIFAKSDEKGLFGVSSFSSYPYLKCFFDLLNQYVEENMCFLVDQDMINDSIDKVLGIDESKIKVNKKQYK